MKKLVIIRGNSGSGKSSLARQLQRELGRNTLVIPQDTVRRDMLWARDGADTEALPLLQTLLRYGYAHSEVTILEGILIAEWYRPLFVRREYFCVLLRPSLRGNPAAARQQGQPR